MDKQQVEMFDFILGDQFDLYKGFAAATSNLISPCLIEGLQDPDFEANNDSIGPTAPLTISNLDLMPEVTRGMDFGGGRHTSTFEEADIHHGQCSGTHATQTLLEREFSDQDALRAVLNRELQNNCIKTSEYIVVIRKVLFEWTLSHCLNNTWLSSGALICPHEHARIFRRLRAELMCVYSDDRDSVNQSDSQRFYTCLGDLDSDINKAHNPMKCKDGEVHVFKEIQPYQECLLLMAEVLENCKG